VVCRPEKQRAHDLGGRPVGRRALFRHAAKQMDPAHYLGSPYYEHWLTAEATLTVEAGSDDPMTSSEMHERIAG